MNTDTIYIIAGFHSVFVEPFVFDKRATLEDAQAEMRLLINKGRNETYSLAIYEARMMEQVKSEIRLPKGRNERR